MSVWKYSQARGAIIVSSSWVWMLNKKQNIYRNIQHVLRHKWTKIEPLAACSQPQTTLCLIPPNPTTVPMLQWGTLDSSDASRRNCKQIQKSAYLTLHSVHICAPANSLLSAFAAMQGFLNCQCTLCAFLPGTYGLVLTISAPDNWSAIALFGLLWDISTRDQRVRLQLHGASVREKGFKF